MYHTLVSDVDRKFYEGGWSNSYELENESPFISIFERKVCICKNITHRETGAKDLFLYFPRQPFIQEDAFVGDQEVRNSLLGFKSAVFNGLRDQRTWFKVEKNEGADLLYTGWGG